MSTAIYDENGEINLKNQLVLKSAGTFVTHPLELSKVLIQLGHEPLNPRKTKTLLGRPALMYPSVFKYCGHIWHKDGITGLWRGFTPKLLNIFVNHYTEQKFNESYPPAEENENDKALTMEQKQEKLVRDTVRDIACKLTCVVATQPLQVIAIRAMAEFVGGEEKYSGGLTFGLYSGACNILQDSGILGFWAGVMPRALGEIGLIAVTSGLTFVVNEYIVDDKEIQKYTKHFVNFLGSSLLYPLQVTSNCMVVSRSGLAAGYPPRMPLYTGWVDCIKHLRSRGELKRGSSMFFRYYNGPQVIIGDNVIPANASMFKSAIKQ